jgi:hypothetical protein
MRVFEIVNALWSLASFLAANNKSKRHLRLNPLLVKNCDDPVVSKAWLLAENSANGNHCEQ